MSFQPFYNAKQYYKTCILTPCLLWPFSPLASITDSLRANFQYILKVLCKDSTLTAMIRCGPLALTLPSCIISCLFYIYLFHWQIPIQREFPVSPLLLLLGSWTLQLVSVYVILFSSYRQAFVWNQEFKTGHYKIQMLTATDFTNR